VAFYSKAILMSFKRFIQIISLLHSKQQLWHYIILQLTPLMKCSGFLNWTS
jgi:hypothetical protein